MSNYLSLDTSTGEVLQTYHEYSKAQEVVDRLSDNKFPVENTAIVAEGLRFVEQVTGRLSCVKS